MMRMSIRRPISWVRRRMTTTQASKGPPPVQTITVNVDGKDIVVDKNLTVLQACEMAGAQIPRFCYHPRLSIAGIAPLQLAESSCRSAWELFGNSDADVVVQVVKSPKPVASCAMPLMPGMMIKTDTPLVKKAREGVMEFLLANHPLDCPICDQGGECDLQELSMSYGSDRGRYREWKRTVEDKNMGPFVKSIMTRCIHCTRCVRYADEIAGTPDLGATGRGNIVEIGTYFEKPFDSELSGNVIDLCPVGALTSKPYAFSSRPWELQKTGQLFYFENQLSEFCFEDKSIDVHDALGSAIRIDTRGSEVMRILPRLNDSVNEEWISDRSRFSYDGLKLQRLDHPLIRSPSGELRSVVWSEAFTHIQTALKKTVDSGGKMRALIGDLANAEAMICLKDWFNSMGCNDLECRADHDQTSADVRSDYVFNSTISGIDQADLIIFVGTNLRMEAPVLNARLRRCQAMSAGVPQLAYIGPEYHNTTHQCEQLGNDLSVLSAIASGSHSICSDLAAAKRPMIIIGQAVTHRTDYSGVRAAVSEIGSRYPALLQPEWNGVNVLQLHASRSAALDLGLTSTSSSSKPDFVYLLGQDQFNEKQVPSSAFVVYQGSHGDIGASRAQVVLPSTAYTESSGIFVNTEGRPQLTVAATTPVGHARHDWQIIRALSEASGIGRALPYDSIEDVRSRLYDVAPHFADLDHVQPSTTLNLWKSKSADTKINSTKIVPAIVNNFTTNVIARASPNLAKAQQELTQSTNSYVSL